MNFLRESGECAYYIVGGTWGQKAIEQALREGDACRLWDGSGEKFSRMPSSMKSIPYQVVHMYTSHLMRLFREYSCSGNLHLEYL